MSMLMNPRALHVPVWSVAAWSRTRAIVSGFFVRWRERSRDRAELRLLDELSEATRRDLGLSERGLRLPTPSARDWTLDRW